MADTNAVCGTLEINDQSGVGHLRDAGRYYSVTPRDAPVAPSVIELLRLRGGESIT